ncbi:ankyrin repeat domain-containing protein [Geomonas oryzisoli]|uniref:Ankyrin repeat domain-containing protein n=1 Tax=Geomonas oryzisoli TaxID=2847992 RepID=A0ABX8JB39_9BACT|nr:ankyrin repeat domain-containing protein [Geomonas oryzisoli]QWV94607.1 ankyrin repeat domain-containing protein [Geomonas oryzisoli]
MTKYLFVVFIGIGALTMLTTTSQAAPKFNLKQPAFYFSDKKTLALVDAALAGDLSSAKLAASQGANPNDEGPLQNKYNRLRPLHYAIAANNKDAVRVLVAVGADPELSALGYGRSFLFAMSLENVDMISLLLDLRPIKSLRKDTLEYLLFEAVNQPCWKCLELVLERGAPIDYPDGPGYTVMMVAMDCQDYEMAEKLLQHGASVHVETKNGVTPAYSVEFHLKKYIPGSPTYKKVLHLKEMMAARGAVFPALSPEEVRGRRNKQKDSLSQ